MTTVATGASARRLSRRGCWRRFLLALLALALFGVDATWAASEYPPPVPAADDSQFGAKIQRTMQLLATSTPEHKNKVRILFYGQSITVQKWWRNVADDLRRRFPHTDLEIENRAIGGFSSQYLVRIAEHDLYTYYPDLLIFHVYGDHRRYEDIIRNTRRRTTAEILIWTDHLAAGEKANEAGEYVDEGWTAFMAKWLLENASKYDCGTVDIRPEWKRYLKENRLTPPDLLRDGVHLNDHGCYLLAELIKRRLVYRPQLAADPNGMVRTCVVGRDVRWSSGKLTLDFTGNRVDVIAADAGKHTPVQVFIDGKKPSAFPDAYAITRPSRIHNIWPSVIRVSWEKPLILEDWTVRIAESDELGSKFRFEVVGSRTGPDGAGNSWERFVSRSGRVVIDPNDWHMERTCKYAKKPVPDGFEIKWKVVPMFVDEYEPPRVEDPAREYATTVIQGIDNTRHRLELVAETGGPVPIRAIRVHKPPLP
ncbi:MAG: hypothetical protein JW741_00295 [Sedimentisphaerales bacterium]|nr:hypothetical protein [Sedimentisphaerales bacterium]